MDDSAFWSIIAAARAAAGSDMEDRVDTLEAQLSKLSLAEVQEFQLAYDRAIDRAYRWDLWGAAYVMNGGCSDDGFRYFRDWLVSEGKEVYERALANPDSLADLPQQDYFELESFGYVAREVFESKGGDDMKRDFSAGSPDPVGEQWDESELDELFPRLAEKYAYQS